MKIYIDLQILFLENNAADLFLFQNFILALLKCNRKQKKTQLSRYITKQKPNLLEHARGRKIKRL